jgi:hypothetical protein
MPGPRLAGAELVDFVLAHPPRVHDTGTIGPPEGVWWTERSCYELLAERCRPGDRTLETGLGASTMLFAALGTRHTCVVPSATEVDLLVAHCHAQGVPTDDVAFVIGLSRDVLPSLPRDELDAFLVDGGHGFPTPMIDWLYGGSRLRRGGLLVLDDLQLPAVGVLTDYLDRDARWVDVARTAKWAAYERDDEGPIVDDHFHQPFYGPRDQPATTAASAPADRRRRFARRWSR